MLSVKRFSGILNTDDKESDVLPNQHINARNIRFTGGANGLTIENIKGNRKLTNANLPTGTNECIGAFYDFVNKVIYFFNYNSNGNNGIYALDVNTETISKVFLCGTDSATDVLGFSPNNPIASVQLVYRPASVGNLLYWTDGNNQPMYLNVSTVSSLAPFTANMLYVAKMPPSVVPTVAYGSDATKNYNNVKNKYFRFTTRFVYKNNEKTTIGPISIVPQPAAIVDPQANTDPNTNNYISVTVNSGTTADFQKIEILGQQFNGTTWGDFFLVTSVDKNDIVTPIPFTYSFNFYNDGIYTTIPVGETDLPFDFVPLKAVALELLNGNTLIYGGITEGYDPLARQDVDVQISASLTYTSGLPAVTKTWKYNNNERFGLVYFDEQGKTNGVISYLKDTTIDTTNFDVTTPQYAGRIGATNVLPQIPIISASINHLPPSWAKTYRWVRIDNAPQSFVQYITNDYQADGSYIYLCIQSLINANNTAGFVPSYEFKEGDRVRIIASYNTANQDLTTFSTQYDFQILDTVDRTMNASFGTPAQTGKFLKCQIPSSFPTPAYSANMLIEIYTPQSSITEENAVFYEWGQEYSITGGYHMGQTQNQTASQPALFSWTNGYVYSKFRQLPGITANTNYAYGIMQDRNYNDYQQSKANDNSRGWVIDENAKQEYFPVTVRWGGSYVQDTDINNLNRFLGQDLDTVDRSKGFIRRFKARDRILRVFQDRGVGQYGIYARYIQNNAGETQLVTTDSIITANNINYYQGTYGLGGYVTNLCSNTIADYFTDVVTGRAIRLSGDGITDLGLLYKGQYYFPQLVAPFNKSLSRSNGFSAKVMGFFDTYDNQYHTILQESTITSPYNFSFNEHRNGFCSFYDFHPEWAISADSLTYTWKNGEVYKHDSSTYCNFYGVQYNADIQLVFNDNLVEKKSWNSISEVASDIWYCPLAYTNLISYGTQRQETNMGEAEFLKLEGMPSAVFKRDIYSRGGKLNGQFIKGNWVAILLRKANASNLVTLSEVYCRFTDSPRTDR